MVSQSKYWGAVRGKNIFTSRQVRGWVSESIAIFQCEREVLSMMVMGDIFFSEAKGLDARVGHRKLKKNRSTGVYKLMS